MYTGVGLNIDIEKGVFDRFRTLPIWRPAALVGMIFGDLLRYTVAAMTIVLVGLALGFRPGGGPAGVLAGIGLLIVFSFAFSWIWTMFGLIMRSEKAVMSVSMLILFPLTFLSNVFVDPSTMPGWLETFVQANPVSHVVTAVRSVTAGEPDAAEIGWVFAASAVLTAVFGTLTMRLYNRK
jgi:ABC-2 type transport system permease protein